MSEVEEVEVPAPFPENPDEAEAEPDEAEPDEAEEDADGTETEEAS